MIVSLSRAKPIISETAHKQSLDQGWKIGAAAFALGLLAFVFVQYLVPLGYNAIYYGINLNGPIQYRHILHVKFLPRLDAQNFKMAYRLSVLTLWSGYILMLAAVFQGATVRAKPLLLATLAAGLVMAFLCPPLLSNDIYAYAGFARIRAVYGQNPYLIRPMLLADVHDPIAPYLGWNVCTVYGPVWTQVTVALVMLLKAVGVWGQTVALKLLEVPALLGAAYAGRQIAERLRPGRGNLALLAIGLNPLALVEGIGNGHNDLLLVGLLMVSAMYFMQGKRVPGALFLGLSISVKLLPIAVLPWILIQVCRGQSLREKVRAIIQIVGLTLLPTVVGFIPFWHGMATLAPIGERSYFHAAPDEINRVIVIGLWFLHHGVPMPLLRPLTWLINHWFLIGIYAGLTLWQWWAGRREADSAAEGTWRWLFAWSVLSVFLMFMTMGIAFPWYALWFWPVVLLRWEKPSLVLTALCYGGSLVNICLYSTLFYYVGPTGLIR